MALLLASSSPRRQDLLRAAGIAFTVHASDAPEVWPQGAAGEGAVVVAEDKLKAAWLAYADGASVANPVWLAADTAVVVDRQVFGKPKNDADAARMLRRLAGRSHEVVTGFVVAVGQEVLCRRSVRTEVVMRPFGNDEVARYVATGEPRGKAGAYAIQGRGHALVDRVYGSLSNVIGLPLAEVLEALAGAGILPQTSADAGR